MEGGERGHGMGEGGHLIGQGWEGGFLQGEIVQVLWGAWGERWGPWLSLDVTGHVGWTVVDQCPHGLLIRWQF